MWHIEPPDDVTLNEYAKKILPGLKGRIEKCGINDIKNALLKDDAGNDTNDILRHLLIFPPKKLRDLSESLMVKIIAGYDIKELPDFVKFRLLEDNKLKANEVVIKNRYKYLKTLEDIFGYDKYLGNSSKKTYEMIKRTNHNTCVYCNRQYAFTIVRGKGKKDEDRIARPALDHWYPESLFPLMSLSYYNLIPSCTICNSSVKLSSIWTLETHIHPYTTRAADPGFSFKYCPGIDSTWEIRLCDFNGDSRVKKTAEDLCLQEVYQCHAGLEVADLLEIARKDNGTYLNQVYDIILKKFGNSTDKEKAYRLLLGTEMMIGNYKNRPFSKLKKDILNQLEKEEGISFLFD